MKLNMKRILVILVCLVTTTEFVAQTNWYVNQQTGSDSNNGMTSSTPFESFEAATDVVAPGDNIFIMGTYSNDSYTPNYVYTNDHDSHLWHAENTILISNLNGNSSNYITIKGWGGNAVIMGDGANIFRVRNSSYLRIEGLEIMGEVQSIPLSTANALQFVYIDSDIVGDPNAPTASDIQYRDEDCISNCTEGAVVDGEVYTDLSGVNVSRPSYIDTRGMYLSNVHHIDIVDNVIHDTPGNGLRVSDCEDILIEGNEVYNCSRKSYSGTHGLVVTKATSTRTTDDYRIRIVRNRIHHNYNEQYSWAPTKTIITPHIDEGKGISLQRNETTDDVNWDHGRILVENNICYFNGFSGIHSNDGNRIDFINNTVYFNSYTKSITEGITSNNGGNIGISAQGGSDVKILNNISIIDVGLSKSAISSNISAADGLVVRDNIIYGTTLSGTTGTINENANVASVQVNTQKVDPLFVDPVNFNFNLQDNSPAIASADPSTAPTNDYFDVERGPNPDLGAIENTSALPVELLSFDALLVDNRYVRIDWVTSSEENNDYFLVQKSEDTKTWEDIDKIDGNNNSSVSNRYSSSDFDLKQGTSYYRLKQVDFDRSYSLSHIEVITNDPAKSEFLVYPNPCQDEVFVKGIDNIGNVNIYDVLGNNCTNHVRISLEDSETVLINMSDLKPGIYFLIKKTNASHVQHNDSNYRRLLRLN